MAAAKTKNLKVTEAQLGNLRWMVKEELSNFRDSDPSVYKSMDDLLTQIDELLSKFN
jgi:hypothetical protein